jgi:hypothetical protein
MSPPGRRSDDLERKVSAMVRSHHVIPPSVVIGRQVRRQGPVARCPDHPVRKADAAVRPLGVWQVSEPGAVQGSVPWSGTARNGMPTGRRYVWRRQGPVVRCPDHPGRELTPLPGGGAHGICPVDGASYQMDAPRVRPLMAAQLPTGVNET